jgi:hypothetical protein
MGILLGAAGTLFGSVLTHFEGMDDRTIARRRARDVFNILKNPALNAGMGIPSKNLDWYFTVGGRSAPVSGWAEPAYVLSNDTYGNTGNAFRVIYSMATGARNGNAEVGDFSTKTHTGKPSTYVGKAVNTPVTVNLAAAPVGNLTVGDLGVIPDNAAGTSPLDTRSFVTFPGVHMSPVLVRQFDQATRQASLTGNTPYIASEDVMWRNVINPHDEVYMVRAGVAYVDSDSRFCFAEISSRDYQPGHLPKGANLVNGYVIEGIKAIKFEQGADRRSLKVTLVAEGDNAISSRRSTASLDELRRKWGDIFSQEVYYEEFTMSLRTRNLLNPSI